MGGLRRLEIEYIQCIKFSRWEEFFNWAESIFFLIKEKLGAFKRHF